MHVPPTTLHVQELYIYIYIYIYTVEPPNNGHFGDKHFVHCLEVVPFSEVLF